jgi:poly(A) polymerase
LNHHGHQEPLHLHFSDEALALLGNLKAFFLGRSIPAFLVGGFLRDALLGRPTRDVDLAVFGDALTLAKALAKEKGGSLVPLNEAHTIARVVLHQGNAMNGWQIDLASFDQDITRDLARRDFTMDALALPLGDALEDSPDEKLIDPFGGLSDIATATVKAVSTHIFQDDPARLLRGVRLSAQLGFSLAGDTHGLIKQDAHLLPTVAPERLRDELLKTLAEPETFRYLRLMDDLDLLIQLIPELDAARGVEQPKEHYWDVLNHCLEASEDAERVTREKGRAGDNILSHVPWHPSLETYFEEEVSDGHTRRTIIKLAGLLHDIAKPATKTIEPNGRMRFFGHDTQGAVISEQILRRLRLSGRGIRLVSTMIEHHLRPTQMNQNVEMPTRRAIYRYFRDLGEAAIDTLYLNLADYLAAKGPEIEMEDWQGHCRLIGHILHQGLEEQAAPQKAPRLLEGHALMEGLALPPGPTVGRLLEALQEAQAAGDIATRDEALALARRIMKSDAPSTSSG